VDRARINAYRMKRSQQ